MDTHTRKRALIWLALAALLLAALGWMLRPQGGTGERIIATISVGDQTVRTIDLTAAGDQEFTILEETGLPITFQVRDHAIRFLSSDCPDKVCVNTGFCTTTWTSPAVCPTGPPFLFRSRRGSLRSLPLKNFQPVKSIPPPYRSIHQRRYCT